MLSSSETHAFRLKNEKMLHCMLLACVREVGICRQNAQIHSFSIYFLQCHMSVFSGLFMTVNM